MIRLYLDWNVISNLKKPMLQELKNFIDRNKEIFLIPYSPSHFDDLMKSYHPDNQLFYDDLEMLGWLSGEHFLRWDGKQIRALLGTPKEYFEHIREQEEDVLDSLNMEKLFDELDQISADSGGMRLGSLMKSLYGIKPSGIPVTDENRDILQKMFPGISKDSSFLDLMKGFGSFANKLLRDGDYYKDFRKTIGDKGMRLKANAGNWDEKEVIERIDLFLKDLGSDLTFLEYVESTFKHRDTVKTEFEFFTTAYLILDMIGYKADKLPKPTDSMQNIQADAEHAFYGAHCDYFIVGDKKLRIKSKVLFHEFGIDTTVLKPEEAIDVLEHALYSVPEVHFMQEVIDYVSVKNVVEHMPATEEDDDEAFAFKLPGLYMDFFNYMTYTIYKSHNAGVYTFKKLFNNYSRFVYYTEVEKLIDRIVNRFGYDNMKELESTKHKFVYGTEDTVISWKFDTGVIRLEKDDVNRRPILSFILLLTDSEEIKK